MQDDASCVSTWTPKTSLTDEQQTATEVPPKEESGKEDSITTTPPAETAAVQSAERISPSSDASQSYHDRLVGRTSPPVVQIFMVKTSMY